MTANEKKKPEKRAAKKTPKWKLIETVVTAIEGAEPGAAVAPSAKIPSRTTSGETRQIDVHVATKAGRRLITMGIEVKNEKAPLDIEIVEQVAASSRMSPSIYAG